MKKKRYFDIRKLRLEQRKQDTLHLLNKVTSSIFIKLLIVIGVLWFAAETLLITWGIFA